LEETKTRKWRWGVNRWKVLIVIILSAIAANAFPPVMPHIQVAPEAVSHKPLFSSSMLGDVYLTNTMIAMLFVDILLLLLVFAVQRFVRTGSLAPKGLVGTVEMLFETLFNMTETSAGVKWAKQIFPYFAIITTFVLVANYSKLLPGYESIGILHKSEHGTAIEELLPGLVTIIPGETHEGGGYGLIGFLRGLPTDLNFTVALAFFSVVMVQVFGVRANGWRYFPDKFFNVKTLFSKPGFGVMDFIVSVLELISEFAKVLSFAFRLFGNMFSGMVLLILAGALVPIFLQSGVLLFELFIGAIQAFVFGMLTMVFMAQATQGHGGGEEHH